MLLALLLSASFAPVPAEGPPPPAELKQLRAALTDTLNQHRAQYGLPPLGSDPIAEQAAQQHAEEMMKTGKLEHVDPEGRSPMGRYNELGGSADFYGENVGYRRPGVLDPVLLWNVLAKLDQDMMAEVPPEDGHRKNILSRNFTAVGIGISIGPNGVYMDEDFSGGHAPAPSGAPARPGGLTVQSSLPPPTLKQLRAALLATLNRHRTDAGLPSLQIDPIAEKTAQFQADDMAAANELRHIDSTGRSPYERYQAFGGNIRSIGENVGNDSTVTVDPALIWYAIAALDREMMNERPPNDNHRKNILSNMFNEVGIGVAVGRSGIYFCEDFSGPPLSGFTSPATARHSSSP